MCVCEIRIHSLFVNVLNLGSGKIMYKIQCVFVQLTTSIAKQHCLGEKWLVHSWPPVESKLLPLNLLRDEEIMQRTPITVTSFIINVFLLRSSKLVRSFFLSWRLENHECCRELNVAYQTH